MRFPNTTHAPPDVAVPASVWRIYLLAGAAVVILSGIVMYGFYMGVRLQRVESPLIVALPEIRLEADSTRMWIDNMLESRTHTQIEGVWK